MSIVKLADFDRSVYKFVKEEFADLRGYPVYYGNMNIDSDLNDVWVYCNFSELNVETGKFSLAYIDIITRIAAIEEYNTELLDIADELKEVFINANIDLYDFSSPDSPVIIPGEKILVMRQLKKQDAIPIFERIEELEFEGIKSLLQAAQLTVRVKLLKNFSRSRVIG
jgi:hypothetical protein